MPFPLRRGSVPRLAVTVLGAWAALANCRPDIEAPTPGTDPPGTGTDAGSDARDAPRSETSDDALPDVARPEAGVVLDVGAPDTPNAEAAPDTALIDAPAPIADAAPDIAPPPPDLMPDLPADLPTVPAGCGSQAPDISGISNVEALTIGKDGTIYFAQVGFPGGWLGRQRPGGAAVEPRWIAVPNGSQLWGLATDDTRQRLYVASASGHVIHMVALAAAQPDLQVLTRDVDEPDDMAIGAGGAIYFPDSDNHLYRVTPDGELDRVSERTFGNDRASGLAFTSTGQLLVGTLSNGPMYRLALAGGLEAGRERFSSFVGSAVGILVDAQGGVLVVNQVAGGESQVLRFGSDGAAGAMVTSGPAFSALAFGRGALSCQDLYIASKTGPLRRVAVAVGGPPALP